MNILITGGTGSLGEALLKNLKGNITVFSRSEKGQIPFKQKYKKVKFILGDVRDYYSVRQAVKGQDIVIHAAAFKFLDLAEKQARECVLTNILGSLNIIEACKQEGVKKVLGISTDKVAYARNVYGCTKHIMEKLFREASGKTTFACVRYGNVLGTTGSLTTIWDKQIANNLPITITDKRMRRFFLDLDDAVGLIEYALKKMKGGEVFILKVPSYSIYELALEKKQRIEEIGLRLGEKLYETLIADYEGKEYTSKDTIERKEIVCLKA